MVPKHQLGDANSLVSFELPASNYFQLRQRIGSSHNYYYDIPSRPIRSSRHLARSWRAFDAGRFWTKRQRLFVQRINCRAKVLRHRVSVARSHLQRGMTQQCHNVHLMHSLGPQTSRKRVTQIVKPKPGDPRLLTCSFPCVPEGCQLQTRAGITESMLV